MARLAAERGAYEKAAESYGQLGLPLPQAHYLVRLAMDYFEEGNDSQAHRALRHAIRAYPGAVEAWLEQLVQAYKTGSDRKLGDILRDALEHVAPELRFVLLEGLLQALAKAENERRHEGNEGVWAKACSDEAVVKAILPVIETQEADVLLHYYGAAFLLRVGDDDNAKAWLEKTLMLQPDFWLARLELFELSRSDQTLTPFFKNS